ncbi:hypothetical protein BD413DRAFT_597393 [Trametes elegans]|nr:hypothetical protein BD413DRAFT_597393 [Trametes elegans]
MKTASSAFPVPSLSPHSPFAPCASCSGRRITNSPGSAIHSICCLDGCSPTFCRSVY